MFYKIVYRVDLITIYNSLKIEKNFIKCLTFNTEQEKILIDRLYLYWFPVIKYFKKKNFDFTVIGKQIKEYLI